MEREQTQGGRPSGHTQKALAPLRCAVEALRKPILIVGLNECHASYAGGLKQVLSSSGRDSPWRGKQDPRDAPSSLCRAIEISPQVSNEFFAGSGDQGKRLATCVRHCTIEPIVCATTYRHQRRIVMTQQSGGTCFKHIRVQRSVEGVENSPVVRVEYDGGPRNRRSRAAGAADLFKTVQHRRRNAELAALPPRYSVRMDPHRVSERSLREAEPLTKRLDAD